MRAEPMVRPEPMVRAEPPQRPEPAPRPEPRVEAPPQRPSRPEPMMPRPMREPSMKQSPRPPERPAAPSPAPLAPSAPSAADQNLADMAQRLEAALRRPGPDGRPEAPEPRVGAPPVAPESPGRSQPAAERPAPPPDVSVKSGFESLEDEMASLAGPHEDPFVRPPNSPRRVFSLLLLILTAAGSLIDPASAQDISINLGGNTGGVTERAIQLIALLTVLSIAPSILIMMTSFTRIVVVLSLLRTALGTATAPPNAVILALALFLTGFVMGPVLQKSYDDGIKPLVANQITVEQAFERAVLPLRGFMQKNVREKDLKLFLDLSGEPPPATPDAMSLRILVPAFMISELKRAFEIGFLLFLPFLVIDLVVASVLMSMGMMMLPPVVVSLPFKLIFFVLVDGWSLVAGSLVQSYGPSG